MPFGFGFALTAIAKAIFSPASLFTNGTQGVFYDPSDYSTLFEDAAGTTPITSPLEKPVGLMLDKSKGLVLGSELASDLTGANWNMSIGGTWSFSGGVATHNGAASNIYAGIVTAGKFYKITFRIQSITTGTVKAYIGIGNNVDSRTVSGTYTAYGIATTNGNIYIDVTLNCDAAISFVSVKELPGNHATQSTTTSRPTLSARYNLLTKTEDFGDAVWTKESVSISPNAINDPNGVLSADKMISASGATYGVANQLYTFVSAQHTYTIYAKAAGYSYLQLLWTSTCSNDYANFNLNTGSVSAGTYVSASITDAGNGWYRCSITSNITAGAGRVYAWIAAASNSGRGITVTGDGTSGIYVWGADLRVANDGIGLPAYQRVNTATDYDYAGFPPYLKFDGTDDGMATGSIDFTGTDKMSVFAGLSTNSASNGMALEMSANVASNPGSFYLFSTATGPEWGLLGNGAGVLLKNPAAFTLNKLVLDSVLDIAGATPATELITRANGSASAATTGSAGTGNFGNYPLYIGRRNNASLPFLGRIYSLVVVGKLASAAEIASTEAWVNQKTRAY